MKTVVSLLPFAAVAFAPVEKKEKRSKSKTAKPLSFKISKKFIKLEISFQLSLHANINFFEKAEIKTVAIRCLQVKHNNRYQQELILRI